MAKLNDFFGRPSVGDRVIGTYLYPYRPLTAPDWSDPYSAIEMVGKAQVGAHEILVTCNGGLFVRLPQHLLTVNRLSDDRNRAKATEERFAFEVAAARMFNHLMCEFALEGIVSEPASPVHVSAGQLMDNHVLITSSAGGRESYHIRTLGPARSLINGEWRVQLPIYDPPSPATLRTALSVQRANTLANVSENLPALIVGTYAWFSQHQLSEALIDGWVVVEQVLDHLWNDHLTTLSDSKRKERLRDSRTYPAAVRTEVLLTAGTIDKPLYDLLNTARKHRNELAHRAKVDLATTTEVMQATKAMVELLCGTSVEPFASNIAVNW